METPTGQLEADSGTLARERVYADLRALSRDAEELLKVSAGDLSEKAKEARSRLSSAIDRAKATCADMQEQTVATAKAAARKADTVIRAHPYESIGIAFGVGLLIGVLVTRK